MTSDLLKQLLESTIKNDDILSLEIDGVIHIESFKNIDNERCYRISHVAYGSFYGQSMDMAIELFMNYYNDKGYNYKKQL